MANTYCPQCKSLTPKAGYEVWQIVLAVCFFPIGLIALDLDGKITICKFCGYSWQA